ncbi:NEAT domain-containing protein [Clostridium tetani]|uniref:NEAT domain-containing protein n=1 Tax=Clostridium tetani TaxID=1513 RepID=UPI0024A850C5|nr:NEAT domain-containing protein [Clostridium tetani]
MKLYPDINRRISIAVAGFLLMSGTHYTVKAASSVTNLPGLEINHGYNKVEAKNKSGLYELNVKTLKEDSDEASMAGGYLEKANYEIKDSKKYFILTLNRTDWMKDITATIDGTQVKPSVQTIEKNDKGEEKGKIRFEIGNLDSKVVLSINVVPMGDSKVSFKVVPEKNTVKLIQEYKEDNSKETQNTKPETKSEAQPNLSSDVKTGTKPEAELDSGSEVKPEVKPDVKPNSNSEVKTRTNIEAAKEGLYELKGKALKEDSDEISKSNNYIDKVEYEIKDGKKYLITNFTSFDIMKNIKVIVDGKDATAEIEKTGNGKKGKVKFEVEDLDSKVKFKMTINPFLFVNRDVSFDLSLEKDTVKLIKEYNQDKPDLKTEEKPDSNLETKTDDNSEVKSDKEPEVKPNVKPGMGNKDKNEVSESVKKDINVAVLKEDSNEPSMAGQYINKNVVYTEKDGKKYFTLTVNKIDWMKDIKVLVDGQSVAYDQKQSGENADLTFEVNGENSEVLLNMNIIPIGNTKVGFRIVNSNSIKPEEKPTEKPNVKPEEENKDKEETVESVKKDLNVLVLKEDSNEPSMAGQYINKNVIYTEKDGKKYFTLTVNKIDWMKDIKVSVDGQSVNYDQKQSGENADLTFEVNGENSEVLLNMNIVPMRNTKVGFRIVNSNSIKPEEKPTEKPDVKPGTGNKDKNEVSESVKKDINVAVLKEDSNELSMAGQYINKNVVYTEKDGKRFFEVTVNKIDWMKDIKVSVDGQSVAYDQKQSGENADLTFEVNGENSEVLLNMNIVPMGNAKVGFRIVNSNLVKPEEKTVEKPEEKPTEKPDVKPEEKPRKGGLSSSTSSGTSNSQNGVYRVDVKILRDKDNTPSMAGQYVKDVVDYEINDNKKYIVVTIYKSNWLKNIDVEVDGRSVKHSIIDEITNSDGEKTSKIKFEVKDLDSKIKFSMNVEPMGNAKVSFRIAPDKNSMKFTGKSSTSKTKNMIRVDFTKPNIDISESGLYSLKGKFLEENEDRDSKIAQYLSKNVNYEVKNNKKYIIIPLKGRENDWKENVKDISIAIDGKFIKHEIINEKTDDGENISKIKFEVPNLDSKIGINMSIIPRRNERVKAVFQVEKDTFKLLKKYEDVNADNNKKEDKVENKTDVIKEDKNNTGTVDKTQKNKLDKNIETKGKTNKPKKSEHKTSMGTEGNKLPQTGSPVGMGLMATLGMMLSGLGFKLKKKNDNK